MCKIWIFGGTTEGRLLAEYCSREKIEAWVSVASEYGEELLQEELMESGNAGNPDLNHNTCLAKKSLKNVQASSVIKVLRGRMDRYQMEEFIRNQGIHLVIDATHPHARLVSEEIQEACGRTGVRLERCLRAEGEQNKARDWVEVDSIQEAVSFLSSVSGVIFVTTGSKELEALCQIPDYQKRVYARVLPTSNVLKKCEKLGITGSHLIAMQGPFSTEMNTLFLRQTKAEWLLTKDSGRAGGFQEKVEAARENGTRVVVIRRPEEDGISLEEAMEVLKKADEGNVGELKTHLILAGIGMGQPSQMTGEVLRAIRESDALIGAGRMLESAERALQNDLLISKEGKAENRQESAAAVEKETKCYKAYLPDDVIQIVSKHPEWKQAVILYSGDTGFFSGASRMAERLREAGYPFTVYPGTSCVSYLAARLGTHWEDAAIYSAHGRELSVDRVMKRLCDPEEPAKRAFILMGGKNGAGQFCERLTQAGYGNVQVTVGENLSYPEEQIRSGTAEEMKKLEFADLSLMLLEVTDEIKNVKQLKRFEQEDKILLPADSVGVFPRIMLAAPKSGSGKTLLTCGLLEVLRRRGLNPIACKCGPDYIDPMFHRYVLGIPGRNLDSFFLPTEGVRKVLVDAVREEQAGIAVLEGVMGYYDGLGGTETSASSWEIAEITDTPAILVLDCKGASLSAAAMASGFLHFRKKSHIAGVILNRVSSMYYERLAAAVEEASGLPVLGYLPESEEYRMESRHLGLFLPGEIDRLRERIGRLADQMEKSIAVERVLEVAGMLPLRIENKEKEKAENESMEAESIAKFPACQEQKVTSRVRIGVARDEAFCFYYQENLHLLEQMGAELVYFSPLRDKKIPDRVDGLLFGGGYPENYARELAKNAAMRESIRRSIAAGMPFLAECGGFLYLHRTLEGSDGKHWEMAGVYPFDAYRTNRLRRFGYVRLLTSSGQEIHGHEFHYWESEDPGTDWEAVKPTGNRSWRCIHEKGGQIGGFPHLYYASCPDFLRKWLDVCAKGSQKKYIN
ncbi:MAG: cobyrinate a,c-diamide synthase [Lachnoclostridium sp.]|uniref:cobyrinate a,c-diamide synthase n=1 Tax=Clostridium TaxID=1485 RepID=UPI00033F3376|nr:MULTISPECIES: cobyrinate a,c-diamide synthase [Clostridium]MCI5802820.1 cobyrinate a,c-diamide synthase [Lachnoclostridium sp.]MDY4928924.1 cobyrinate a,c-diamide synthase [Clostridium fessum]CDD59967.1 cobyrinic acid A C-diamide synthase [Clostridium sp. CAG:43]